ncbi:hypothetical protein PDESU_05625 [Pontiella desulfatans]|uniref:Uncharacterized protein n=1 Tax=Pontiella desulfatans TaxID=2750659 RepID=A0A6C2UC84_PONDE|nr:hypothetical protein [Pontiella desulfatans]VGO17031.1 hypothetical protein PDESU_05625 [Pontiella desulfatans]
MGFIFILVIVGVVIYFGMANNKKNQAAWQAAADRLNLAYYGGGFGSMGTISGSVDGHRINISTFTKGSGNSSQAYTKYTVEYRHRIKTDVKMTRQGALHKLGKVFGLEDITVGDAAFDEQVLVRGADSAAVRKLLTPDLRDAIRLMVITFPDITITNEHVCVNKKGKDTEISAIVRTARHVLQFSDQMNASFPAAKPPGNVRVVDPVPPPPPIPAAEEPEPGLVEIEPVELPFDPYTIPNPVVPDPPMIPVAEEPEPELPAVEEEPVDQEPEPVAEPVVLNLEQAAKELFGGDSKSSLEASKVFEGQYKGRSVEGSGVLKRIGRISYDSIFGNHPGIKATLEICELSGPYSQFKVEANVLFPLEKEEALRAMVGEPLSISGTLIAQDAIMKRLYIAAG